MARKAKKRYVRATVECVEHVFEFDVEELDNQKLVAMALGERFTAVRNVSPNSASTAKPSWYTRMKSAKHQFEVDYEVRK